MNLAIFGGTFDPVHTAHLEIARAARREFFLDKVLFVPASHPPHKPSRCHAPYEARYEMCRLAAADHPSFEASRLEAPELTGGGKNFTIHTILRVTARVSATQGRLFFIIGADAFKEIATWFRWRHVAALVEFIVVARPGFPVDDTSVPPGVRVHWLRSVQLPISSSEIRQRLRKGKPLRGLAPAAVARYISRNKLYRPRPRPRRRPARRKKRGRARPRRRR